MKKIIFRCFALLGIILFAHQVAQAKSKHSDNDAFMSIAIVNGSNQSLSYSLSGWHANTGCSSQKWANVKNGSGTIGAHQYSAIGFDAYCVPQTSNTAPDYVYLILGSDQLTVKVNYYSQWAVFLPSSSTNQFIVKPSAGEFYPNGKPFEIIVLPKL